MLLLYILSCLARLLLSAYLAFCSSSLGIGILK